MDGDFNGYGRTNSNASPPWGRNNVTTTFTMEPLVDQFGNLRFNNRIIPLTTNIAPFIGPSPSLPNLTTPTASFQNLSTSHLHVTSPVPGSPSNGPFYVVRMPNSSTSVVSEDQRGVYQFQNTSTPPQSPSSRVIRSPSQNGNTYAQVHMHQNYRNDNDDVDGGRIHVINSAHAQSKYGSTDGKRHVSEPDRMAIPFRGQPYMKQLSLDSSNGEVFRSPEIAETEVPPLSSAKYNFYGPVEDNYVKQNQTKLVYVTNSSFQDGTDNSSLSSMSVSPYSSVPSSPRLPEAAVSPNSDTKHVYEPVPPRYVKPSEKSRCLMCDKTVYAMEKRGPIKDVLFHKTCFRCAVCGMVLSLKNFSQNDNDLADLNVYCQSHKPTEKHGRFDAGALSIARALTAPRLGQVNEQIRGGPEAMRGGKLDMEAMSIKSAMNVPKPSVTRGDNVRNTQHSYTIDNDDIAIVHARNAPDTGLHVSNKIRQQVWSRGERKSEGLPPPDVIRHDTDTGSEEGFPYRHDPPPENTYRHT